MVDLTGLGELKKFDGFLFILKRDMRFFAFKSVLCNFSKFKIILNLRPKKNIIGVLT